MKNTVYITLICWLAALTAGAQNFTEQKKYHQSYKAGQNTELTISNKYGNIMVVPSENDSISIDVDIIVTDKDAMEAKEQLDEISVDFVSTGYLIQAITVFNGNRNDFKTDWKMFAGNVFSTSKTVRVEFRVAIPAGVSLTVLNSYGNVMMPDYAGVFKLTLDGGDFTSGSLTGKSTLNITGGKAQCRFLSDAIINADMSELLIDSVGNAYFDTRASQIHLQKGGNMTIDSRRDKWFIGSAVQISGSGNFSSFSITRLERDCNLNTFYGNLTIQSVAPSFHSINLISSYCDVSMGLPTDVIPSFQSEMKKTRSLFPARLNLKTDTIDFKAGIFRSYNAVENPAAFINMNLTGGSVSVY